MLGNADVLNTLMAILEESCPGVVCFSTFFVDKMVEQGDPESTLRWTGSTHRRAGPAAPAGAAEDAIELSGDEEDGGSPTFRAAGDTAPTHRRRKRANMDRCRRAVFALHDPAT